MLTGAFAAAKVKKRSRLTHGSQEVSGSCLGECGVVYACRPARIAAGFLLGLIAGGTDE